MQKVKINKRHMFSRIVALQKLKIFKGALEVFKVTMMFKNTTQTMKLIHKNRKRIRFYLK